MATVKSTEVTRGIAVSAREPKGLCVTCNYAENCAVCTETREPVWYCEEFDDHMAPAEARDTNRIHRVRSDAETKPNGAAEGLCSNCETRETCCNRTALAGPVWYCEQYC